MPETQSLICAYCGQENESRHTLDAAAKIVEFDIADYEREVFNQEETVSAVIVKCGNCAAETTLGQTLASKNCPFCGTPLVIQQNKVKRLHKPHYILPFAITEKQATAAFQRWIKKLWFAPRDLKKYTLSQGSLQGIYLPFWTYDCFTQAYYRGERGEEYTVWVRGSNGRSTAQTRVRWYPAGGVVHNIFDDVLIAASRSLPKQKLEALAPWDLHHLKTFNSEYLHGFKTENYQLTLRQGFAQAKLKMNEAIRAEIRRDIGGNQQRIHSVQTEYKKPTFKHILLPTWVSAFYYKHKTYQFVVNARTAEVQGERPYSIAKILFAISAALGLVYLIWATDWAGIQESIAAGW